MCGIAGVISKRHEVSQNRLKAMTDIIAHRGPDGDGFWLSDNGCIGLAHRRLSIIDLSDMGGQPMHYRGRYTITFNGEIYNYVELREQLQKKGHSFRSASDTEVLLALYDEYKENCLTYLDGMFSFAIWDAEEQSLFFARDRFGEKPFHYAYKKGEYFIFGSEMKEIWNYGIEREINPAMFYRYLVNGDVFNTNDTTETFFSNIYRLPACHYGKVFFQDLSLTTDRYWDLDYQYTDTSLTEDEVKDKFRELLLTSVSRRLRSDVPVGSSLSGGLDSSVIVCAIDELSKGSSIQQNTFSARFPGFVKDEGVYMQKVLDKINVDAHFTYPSDEKMFSSLEKVLWHQEEPFSTASIFVQYDVMRLAKEKNVTVLLDGQGADEILAGYHYYFPYFFSELKRTGRTNYASQLTSYQQLHAANKINPTAYKPGLVAWGKEQIGGALKGSIRKKMIHLKQFTSPFLNPDFMNAYKNLETGVNKRFNSLNHVLYNSTTGPGLQELLRYADRNSMAHSREVRLPFLSHELVEFIFSLPTHYKIRDGWTKYILRASFDHIVPQDIAWRKDKIGYEPPQQQWLASGNARDFVRAQVERLVDLDIVHKKVLQSDKMIDDKQQWRTIMAGLTSANLTTNL